MEREPGDTEVIAAFRAEAERWRPRRVPNLLDLTVTRQSQWQRPLALASAMGATALAIVLLLSVVVVVMVPASLPGMAFVKDHLTTPPFP